MKRRTLILALDVLVFLVVVYAAISMITISKDSVLVTGGLGAFKYYTVDSNILCAITSLICAIWMLLNRDRNLPDFLYVLHLTGVAVVSVTFVVVIIFLGPRLGYALMYTGVSFWLHLVAPVFAIIAQILLKHQDQLRMRSTCWTVVPTIVYGVFYVTANVVNWTGKTNRATDIYGFLTWGWAIGAILLVAICLINWLIALFFWKLGKKGSGKTDMRIER